MHPGPNPSADHRDRTPAGQAGGRGAAPGREVLAGLVERVTFHNPETGFCVLRLKARGHRDLVTAVGHAAMISAGEGITASGEWTNDRTHGRQFRVRFLKASAPSSVEGIEKYLGSGLIRGIGPVYATRLVRLFGTDVFDIIEASPARLREVAGIGPKRADRITAAWADQKRIRDGVPAPARRRHGPRGAHLQDLRRRCRAGPEREPLPAGPRHPGHRLPYRRSDRGTTRHREDRADPRMPTRTGSASSGL